VILHGVNRSSTEYACVQGWGIFDGPSDAASVEAIAARLVNAMRVPLNEDCWLGINGVKPAYAGAIYRPAISDYVTLLNAHGLAAILELHWSAPGAALAQGQPPMPDQDHSIAFWQSVAETFCTPNGRGYRWRIRLHCSHCRRTAEQGQHSGAAGARREVIIVAKDVTQWRVGLVRRTGCGGPAGTYSEDEFANRIRIHSEYPLRWTAPAPPTSPATATRLIFRRLLAR
jgi:hypothetical protein